MWFCRCCRTRPRRTRRTPKIERLKAACVALALAGGSAFASAAAAGDWIADPGTGCRVWNPHPQGGESIQWSGACQNGLAHGRGVAKWSKNSIPYETDEGEWREGRQVGPGTQVWPGGRYEGDLLDSEPDGRGKLTLQGVRYEGSFRAGKPNGAGILTNGSEVLTGSWVDGCFRDAKRKASFMVPLSACR
jgi:hypothetical protein